MTTIEVFNAINLQLHLGIPSAFRNSTSVNSAGDLKTAYGTLSLDPSLHAVRIVYAESKLINAIIFNSIPEGTISDVVLAVMSTDGPIEHKVAGQAAPPGYSSLQEEQQGQFHILWDSQGWHAKRLQRKEKDYPVLDKNIL